MFYRPCPALLPSCSGTSDLLQGSIPYKVYGEGACYAEIALGIIGGSLGKRIIGNDFSDDVTIVHVTILLPRISLEAPAA